MSAEVQITLRGGTLSAPSATARPIPLEPFSINKDMGRVLVRHGGETIAAGKPQLHVRHFVRFTLAGIVLSIIE